MSKKKHLEIYRTTKKVTEPDEVPPTGPTKLRDYTLIVNTTTEAFGVNKIQPPAEHWHQSLERACTTNCRISAAVLVILFICSLVVFGGFFEPPRMFIYCVMGSIACVPIAPPPPPPTKHVPTPSCQKNPSSFIGTEVNWPHAEKPFVLSSLAATKQDVLQNDMFTTATPDVLFTFCNIYIASRKPDMVKPTNTCAICSTDATDRHAILACVLPSVFVN